MANQQLAIRENEIGLSELGGILAKSGYFQDAREAAQCVVKVLAGREMGFGPIASMTGINIIKGKVSPSANIMAAAVKRSGRYDYKVRELNNEICRLEFFELASGKWESSGMSEFSIKDAAKAGTQNTEKFPRNMLYARAMSNGVRWYCPDVTGGPAYTPEELGAMVDGETGEVIEQGNHALKTEAPKPAPAGAPAPVLTYEVACETVNTHGKKYGALTDGELEEIINHPKAPADKKAAADIILAHRVETRQAIMDAQKSDDQQP